MLCKDGDADTQFLHGLTRDGRIFDFAAFLLNERERPPEPRVAHFLAGDAASLRA